MFKDLKTQPNQSHLAWLLPFQKAQEIHDRLYCRDVACMAPTDRAVFLVMLLAKYVSNIQADTYTSNNGMTTGKRVTDILITTTSLLTALGVSIQERLEKLNVPSHVNGEQALMQWLSNNYVFDMGPTTASVNDVYERNMQYLVAMPVQLYKAIDAAENTKLMQTATNSRSALVNAAMHLWVQAVISHTRHRHTSFIYDMTERLHEVELKSIHSQSFGLFPNYSLDGLYQ